MNLKKRLYLLALLPVILLTIIITCIAVNQLAMSVFDTNYSGMQATTTALRDLYQSSDTSEDADTSQIVTRMDEIKKQTGYDVTFFKGDTRYLTTITDEKGERVIGTKASDEVIADVLNKGLDYKNNNVNILGTRYIAYYIPTYNSGTTTPDGMVFLGVPYSEVFSTISAGLALIMIPALILLILALLFAWRQGNKVTDEINSGISYVKQLEKGELGFVIDKQMIKRTDIIGDMCRSIHSLNRRLTRIMKAVKQQCDILDSDSATAKRTADNLTDSISQISAVVEEVAATTTSQAGDADHANKNIQSMGDLIEHISSESTSAMSALNELFNGMKQVDAAVNTISKQTDQTCSSVDKIDSAAELISSISLQTKLLSLNASIEAARAGEFGKGFAVVAAEIQQLAHGSEESTKEIQAILDELKLNSETSLNGTKDVMKTVASLRDKLQATEEVFTTLIREIGSEDEDSYSTSYTNSPSLHSERVKTITAINGLATASEEIAASMEETAASVETVAGMAVTMGRQADSLNEISDTLSEHLKYFTINE
jgi:methyl-accepting chemotaxis protein